ncbi:MAG: hypothetical protein HYV76_02145 [Candidatus Vogelbacteria bacterium]|nr:hypothetical protein [Candidatus Vogelbacteria bacterium]
MTGPILNSIGSDAATSTITQVIKQIAVDQKVDSAPLLAIARCESQYRQYDQNGDVLRGKHNARDVGIFQINERFHLEQSQKLGFDIYTAEGNIRYAIWLSEKEGIGHWSASKPCWGKVVSQIAIR